MNKNEVARKILLYLIEHPEAADTNVGIATWWLNSSMKDSKLNELTDILEELCRSDFLVKKTISSSSALYALNLNSLSKIRERLDQDKGLLP